MAIKIPWAKPSFSNKEKKYLANSCDYMAVEASLEFASILSKRKIKYFQLNLHEGLNIVLKKVDVITMIISLCQFRDTSMHDLLECFKRMANKVIILEDVLVKPRDKNSFLQRTMNYLCSTDYYQPITLLTADEFKRIMAEHNYTCRKHSDRYLVGYYNSSANN